jgi:hypothetical protein
MDLLSDKNIELIVKRKHSEIEERLFDALTVELTYLANKDVLKKLDESDLIKINSYIEKVDKYKSGRCNSLKEIIKNVQLSVL